MTCSGACPASAARYNPSRNCALCESISRSYGKNCGIWMRIHGGSSARTIRGSSWSSGLHWKENVRHRACPSRGGPFMLPSKTGWRKKPGKKGCPHETTNATVGMAAAPARCLVGSFADGRDVTTGIESAAADGAAEQCAGTAMGYPLDGVFRQMPAALFTRLCGSCRHGPVQYDCHMARRFRALGRRVWNCPKIPG